MVGEFLDHILGVDLDVAVLARSPFNDVRSTRVEALEPPEDIFPFPVLNLFIMGFGVVTQLDDIILDLAFVVVDIPVPEVSGPFGEVLRDAGLGV